MSMSTTTTTPAGLAFSADGPEPTIWHGIESNKWTVTLAREGYVMTLPYHMGLGLSGEPTLADVLECLASDAAIIENDELDDVLGDIPSSEARKTAAAMERQTEQLRRLLGDDYNSVVFPEGDES